MKTVLALFGLLLIQPMSEGLFFPPFSPSFGRRVVPSKDFWSLFASSGGAAETSAYEPKRFQLMPIFIGSRQEPHRLIARFPLLKDSVRPANQESGVVQRQIPSASIGNDPNNFGMPLGYSGLYIAPFTYGSVALEGYHPVGKKLMKGFGRPAKQLAASHETPVPSPLKQVPSYQQAEVPSGYGKPRHKPQSTVAPPVTEEQPPSVPVTTELPCVTETTSSCWVSPTESLQIASQNFSTTLPTKPISSVTSVSTSSTAVASLDTPVSSASFDFSAASAPFGSSSTSSLGSVSLGTLGVSIGENFTTAISGSSGLSSPIAPPQSPQANSSPSTQSGVNYVLTEVAVRSDGNRGSNMDYFSAQLPVIQVNVVSDNVIRPMSRASSAMTQEISANTSSDSASTHSSQVKVVEANGSAPCLSSLGHIHESEVPESVNNEGATALDLTRVVEEASESSSDIETSKSSTRSETSQTILLSSGRTIQMNDQRSASSISETQTSHSSSNKTTTTTTDGAFSVSISGDLSAASDAGLAVPAPSPDEQVNHQHPFLSKLGAMRSAGIVRPPTRTLLKHQR